MANFTVVLPSNVINKVYEGNTIAHYRTNLAAKQILEGDWSVGLSAISYTKSWVKTLEPEYIDLIKYKQGKEFEIIKNYIYLDLHLFNDPESLVTEIKAQIGIKQSESEFVLPQIDFNEKTNRIEMKLGERKSGPILFNFSANLCRVLGIEKEHLEEYIRRIRQKIEDFFEANIWEVLRNDQDFLRTYVPAQLNEDEKIYVASAPVSFYTELKNLYVYCNLIKHSIVGSKTEQLLRIVEVPSDSVLREQISLSYPDIQYHSLMIKEFDDIEINIKDQYSELVPFQFGRVIVTLHFKKHE